MKILNTILQEYRKKPETFKNVEAIINILLKDIDKLNIFIDNAKDFWESSTHIEEEQDKAVAEELEVRFAKGLPTFDMPFSHIWIELPNNNWNGVLLNAIYLQEIMPNYQRVMFFNKRRDLFGEHLEFSSFSIVDGKLGVPRNCTKQQEATYRALHIALYLFFRKLTINNMIYTEPKEEIHFKGRVDGVYVKYKGKPNNVIYVGNKKDILKENPTIKIKSRPDHQYEVMGHWRKLKENSIGKDREGMRKVKGYTWVSSFIKGPEGTALIKKIRIIK